MDNAFSDMEISAGERLYVQCTGCHAPDYNRTGPKHCGILGSVAGSVKNFTYTKAMANSKIVWTRETLDQFLVSPLKMVPGTSMGFVGISSAKQRQQLVSYLSQLNEKNTICK
ncbi:hypothetical protein JYT79_02970 [Cardiobacterium sp. AH-315-I02]|nr:hypothetical protein [Cardiobacterium sp. AH-315-I02]